VLTVPVASVVNIDDNDGVAVRTPQGAIEFREVTLGRSNTQAVEVKQGLKPGDRVFLDPKARMTEPAKGAPRSSPMKPPPPDPR